jgi:hypothetical protein
VPKFLGGSVSQNNFGSTRPRGLDTFFVGNTDKFVDVILNCALVPLKQAPIHWTNNFLIRGNIENLCGYTTSEILRNAALKKYEPAKMFAKTVVKIVNTNLQLQDSVEKWVLAVLRNTPLNAHGCPNSYPKNISEKTLQSRPSVSQNQIFVEYDIRLIDRVNNIYKIENAYINLIEDGFEKNKLITIYNTFNNILDEIKKRAKHKRIKIVEGCSKEGELEFIKIKFYDFRALDIKYDLTDFF